MAIPANTVLTFGMNGIREDLTDTITRISPMETPFFSAARKEKANAQYHEWQKYDLAAAATNAHPAGDDTAAGARNSTTRLGNRAQIMKKVISTSGSAQAAPTAGRSNEQNFQVAMAAQELKRDVEFNLIRSGASSAGATGTAATTGQLENWLSTNNASKQPGQTTPGFASGNVGAVTDAATANTTFVEADLKTLLGNIWDAGGDPDVIMVNKFNKQQASSFSGIATQYRDNQDIGPAAIIGSADIYVGDFGTVAIVPNRRQRESTVFALEMSKFAVAFYRPFKRETLAKTGDSTKEHIVGELLLVSDNEAASGKLADRATA